jgi:hypothetical protein
VSTANEQRNYNHPQLGHAYLFLDLESFLLSNCDGVSPRAGVQHTLLDRRSSGAGVHEDHDIRSGVMIERIARRGGGNVCCDRVRLDSRLGVGQDDLLRGDINSLPSVSLRSHRSHPHCPSLQVTYSLELDQASQRIATSRGNHLQVELTHHPADPSAQT